MRIRIFPLLFAACIWPLAAAHAGGPQPGNLNYLETRNCSEQGCGDFEPEYLDCPPDSKFVWVTRSGEFEVFLACYFD